MTGQHVWTQRLLEGPDGPRLVGVVGGIVWLWSVNAYVIGPVPGGVAAAIELGVGLPLWRRWWRTRTTRWERDVIARWEHACTVVGIVNPPTIRRRPDGRLDVRVSAASLTLQVQVEPTVGKDDNGRCHLRKLSDLVALAENLKVAIGGDVAKVDVHARRGNHATVVIVTDLPDTASWTERISETHEITVLSRAPNRAWVAHAEFGGYVLAQHRHAVRFEPPGDDPWIGHLELDDDEDAAWWINNTHTEPRSSTPIGPPQPPELVYDLGNGDSYTNGGGERAATPPWPDPTGAPAPLAPPRAA